MLKSTLNDTPAPASLVENGPPVIPSQQLSSGASVSISLAQPPLNQSADGGGTSRVMKGYLSEKLDDAERLLGYAAEIGVDIEEDTRNDVLKARFASDIGISEQTAANLLSALTKLAARMRPVTAESLKVCATP